MKIGVRLFLSSMIFGVVISVVYGFTRHDVVGSVFLGMMALALVIVAIFIVVAEPEANLAGDQPEMSGRHRRRKARSLRPRKLSADPGRGGYNAFHPWHRLRAGDSFGLMLVGAALIAWTLRFLVREST